MSTATLPQDPTALLAHLITLPDTHALFKSRRFVRNMLDRAVPDVLAHLATRPSAVATGRSLWPHCMELNQYKSFTDPSLAPSLELCAPTIEMVRAQLAIDARVSTRGRRPMSPLAIGGHNLLRTGDLDMFKFLLTYSDQTADWVYNMWPTFEIPREPRRSLPAATRIDRALAVWHLGPAGAPSANIKDKVLYVLVQCYMRSGEPHLDDLYTALSPQERLVFADLIYYHVNMATSQAAEDVPDCTWGLPPASLPNPLGCLSYQTWFDVLPAARQLPNVSWPQDAWDAWIAMCSERSDYSFFLTFIKGPSVPDSLKTALANGSFPLEARAYFLSKLPQDWSSRLGLFASLAAGTSQSSPR